jgi:hypothetical protein
MENFSSSPEPFSFDVTPVVEMLYNNSQKYGSLLEIWRKKIKNCRFQCWNCIVCSDIIAAAIEHLPPSV